MKAFLNGTALLLAVSLAGCATRNTASSEEAGGIAVTRTHLGQAIARGQIAVEPFEAADANSADFGSYASAVSQQLSTLGWTVSPTRGQTEQVALINVSEGSATGGAGVATTLDVRIRRRSEGSLIWQGRAVSEARQGSSSGERVAAVQRLAAAVFRDFPGESGRTIRTR